MSIYQDPYETSQSTYPLYSTPSPLTGASLYGRTLERGNESTGGAHRHCMQCTLTGMMKRLVKATLSRLV